MFNVYNDHGTSHTRMPSAASIDEVRRLAEASARLGYNALYRAFERTSESVTGERFTTAFSVLNGVVREHAAVTIPTAHW